MTAESRFEARPEFPYRQDDAASGSAATPPPTVGLAATQTPATVRPGGRSASERTLSVEAEDDALFGDDDWPYQPIGPPRTSIPEIDDFTHRLRTAQPLSTRDGISALESLGQELGRQLARMRLAHENHCRSCRDEGLGSCGARQLTLARDVGPDSAVIVAEPSEQSVEGFIPSTSTKQVGAAEALSTTRPDPRAVEDEHGEDRVLTEPGAQPTPAGDAPRLCRYCGRLEAARPRPGSALGPASEGACIPCWPYGGTGVYRFVECSFCGVEQPDDRRKCRHCFERLPLNQVLIDCPKCEGQFSAGRFHQCPRVR